MLDSTVAGWQPGGINPVGLAGHWIEVEGRAGSANASGQWTVWLLQYTSSWHRHTKGVTLVPPGGSASNLGDEGSMSSIESY